MSSRISAARLQLKHLKLNDFGVSQYQGYHSGGPYDKDSIIFGSILGPPIWGSYRLVIHVRAHFCDNLTLASHRVPWFCE